MKKTLLALSALLVLCLFASTSAMAVTAFDQDITPDVIFGSGNANGSWTTERANGLEIGLRAKLRYNASCAPENTFNSNGDGTYSFAAGVAPDGPGGAADCAGPETSVWNFEWSVNTDDNDTTALNIDSYTYELGMDFDETLGTSFCTFDNITPSGAVPFFDHAIGNNTTVNGGGTSAVDPGTYATLINTENVAQNSWRYEYFDAGAPCGVFDPDLDGTYTVYLKVLSGGTEIGRSTIEVVVGAGGPPALPMNGIAGLAALVAGLALLLGLRARKNNREQLNYR